MKINIISGKLEKFNEEYVLNDVTEFMLTLLDMTIVL